MDSKYDYVIYHKHCVDGFTGFFILTQTNLIKDNAMIFPDVPSAKDIPPGVENKNVIIIDVAYKAELLHKIIKKATKVTFIDHHVSIKKDIEALNVTEPHEIIYDEMESGASLTWKYLHKNKPMPKLVEFVKDNDIGTWKLKDVYPFMLGIQVNYLLEPTHTNIKKWKKLLKDSEINKMIKKGKEYEEYKEHLLDENTRRYSLEKFPSEKIFKDYPTVFKHPGQYKVAVYCGSGCPSTSALGAKFMEKLDCDFSIMWTLNLDRKEYVMAFRSGGEKQVDVSEIAKAFNGGGHKLAAACSFSSNKYNITDLFFPTSLPRHTH